MKMKKRLRESGHDRLLRVDLSHWVPRCFNVNNDPDWETPDHPDFFWLSGMRENAEKQLETLLMGEPILPDGVDSPYAWMAATISPLLDEIEQSVQQKIASGQPSRLVFYVRLTPDEEFQFQGSTVYSYKVVGIEEGRNSPTHEAKKPKRSFVQEFVRTVERRMPSKIMSESYYNLDEFTSGYLQAALWSSVDPDTGEPLDGLYTVADITEAGLDMAIFECDHFQSQAAEAAMKAGAPPSFGITERPHKAGVDFWLTRNGHGAGFWDGDWEWGEELTNLAKSYLPVHLYVGDDERIHGF